MNCISVDKEIFLHNVNSVVKKSNHIIKVVVNRSFTVFFIYGKTLSIFPVGQFMLRFILEVLV